MSELHKLELVNFIKGANSDDSIESIEKGNYYDATNIRLSSEGNMNIAVKIAGEEEHYDLTSSLIDRYATADISLFKCMGSRVCKNQLVTFWASSSSQPTGVPNKLIFIDSILVSASDIYQFDAITPLQMDVNESCKDSEVFITNEGITPLIFNLSDLLQNVIDGSDKYFESFNIGFLIVNLQTPNDIVIFDSLEDGSGLKVGFYSYSFQYVDSTGNVTKPVAFTPFIPLPKSTATDCVQYPSAKSYSASEGADSNKHIKLKFRVNNKFNYSYIKMLRVYSNTGGQISSIEEYTMPTELTDGLIDVWDFTDSGTGIAWITLSTEALTISFPMINSAKTLRYYANRLILMNIKYAPKDKEDEVSVVPSSGGEDVYPFIHKMEKTGHADVYNSTYYKSYPSGEKFGIGILVYENNEPSFVVPVGNVTYPNRRLKLSDDTKALSVDKWKGAVIALDTLNSEGNNGVGEYTHEVFDLADTPESKKTLTSTIAISKGIRPIGFNPYGSYPYTYNPLTPKKFTDSYNGLAYTPNDIACMKFEHDFLGSDDITVPLPPIFAPSYYSHGLAIDGITLPQTATSFSVVRTKRANRVIAQGIATYAMIKGKAQTDWNSDEPASKANNKFWFYSDDVTQLGIALQDKSNLKIQFVSPLGFSTEVYSGDIVNSTGIGDYRCVDMISFARIMRENGDINTKLLDSLGNKQYNVGFGKWRDDFGVSNPFGATVNGDKIFPIKVGGITTMSDPFMNRNKDMIFSIELELGYNCYFVETGSKKEANDYAVQSFHEPFYIVNIIDDSAEVESNNINNYVETGHYQKIESVVGEGLNIKQTIPLVDERFDDCIVNDFDSNKANINVYVYIRDEDTQIDHAWLNVRYKSTAQVTAILQDMLDINGYHTTSDGVRVYGIYSSIFNAVTHSYSLIFDKRLQTLYGYSAFVTDDKYFLPKEGQKIIVKYDKRFPIKFFGGDTYIGESVACLIDGTNDSNGRIGTGSNRTQFFLNMAMPYPAYKFSSRYKVPTKAKNYTTDRFRNGVRVQLEFIRQWLVMFTSESKVHLPLSYNIDNGSTYSGYQCYPRTNYIQRPWKWDPGDPDSNFGIKTIGFFNYADKINEQYKTDFPEEYGYWQYGGFKFMNKINVDYLKEKDNAGFTNKPVVSYKDETDFCTMILWSESREPNVQDAPNLKTFPALNFFTIADAQGEIKFAFDTETSKGENLYAFCEKGICLLLTQKDMLASSNGDTVGYMNSANFIAKEYWLSKEIGMNNELWRGASEFDKILIFPNKESVYLFFDNKVSDIGRGKYHKMLKDEFINQLLTGYGTPITSVIDRKHNEYWLNINNNKNFVYSIDREQWFGKYTIEGERFVANKSETEAIRGLKTYKQDIGLLLNGVPIEAELIGFINTLPYFDKEFIAVSLQSNVKPTSVEFGTTLVNLPLCELSLNTPTANNIYYLKNYGGKWTNKIPRQIVNGNRLQGRFFVYRIKHNTEESFLISDLILNYRQLNLQI